MAGAWHKPYRGYLFDLDGTLIDTAPDLNAALNHCLGKAGLAAVPEALTRHWVGHGARVLVEQALQHHGVAPATSQVDVMHQDFLDFYAQHNADHSLPYPTVLATLTKLQTQNCSLCVVTNKLEQFSRRILDQLEMTHFFDQIIGGDTAAQPKPDPAPVELCLHRMGLSADQVLFVGDSVTDVKAARNAGVAVVCVADGYNQGVPAEQLGADGVINSFADLITQPSTQLTDTA